MTKVVLQHDGLSRPATSPRLRILSLGAGVQSTTLALMAARGDIETPDCAIFADTGDEPAAVYQHLGWLERQLPYPVHRVRNSKSLSAALREGDDMARIPFHVGAGGLATRQCTRNWKLRPIRRKTRELLGVSPRSYLAPGTVESWVGISTDEIVRVRPSGVAFLHNRHPLIEARMSREDCKTWLHVRQYPIPPKSACRYCPFQGNRQWAELKANAPVDFEKASALDRWLREPAQVARFRGELYVHSSLQPLDAADLHAEDAPDLFADECEGMCGV